MMDGGHRYQSWLVGIDAPLSPQDVYNRPLNKKDTPAFAGVSFH